MVEDEFLVALSVQDVLEGLGCTIIGPLPDLAQALAAVRTEPMTGAVLDINLSGEKVYPVAEELLARGIPFVFTTGYGLADLPDQFRNLPSVQKPFNSAILEQAVRTTLLKS